MRLSHLLCLDCENKTCCDSHTHITDCESSELWEFLCSLDNERAGRSDGTDCCIASLKECRVLFLDLSRAWVELLVELSEHTCGLGSVAVEDRSVSDGKDGRVLKDNDLCGEFLCNCWRVLDRTTDISAADVVLCDTTDVETNVVSRNCLWEFFVVHFDGLNFTGNVCRHEGDLLTLLEDTSLDTSYWDSSNTRDGVNVLDRKSEGLVSRHVRLLEVVECCKESGSLVPWGVCGCFLDVVADECGNWDERSLGWLETNGHDELGHLFLCFVELLFGVLNSVHLVDCDDDLVDTESLGKEDVLFGLLHWAFSSGNDDDCCISLGCTSDHVLNEVTVTWTVYDGKIVLRSFELLVCNIDSDTALTFLLEGVHYPCKLKRALTLGFCFFLVGIKNVLCNDTGLEKDTTDSRGLTVVNVTDNGKVHVWLVCCHSNVSPL